MARPIETGDDVIIEEFISGMQTVGKIRFNPTLTPNEKIIKSGQTIPVSGGVSGGIVTQKPIGSGNWKPQLGEMVGFTDIGFGVKLNEIMDFYKRYHSDEFPTSIDLIRSMTFECNSCKETNPVLYRICDVCGEIPDTRTKIRILREK